MVRLSVWCFISKFIDVRPDNYTALEAAIRDFDNIRGEMEFVTHNPAALQQIGERVSSMSSAAARVLRRRRELAREPMYRLALMSTEVQQRALRTPEFSEQGEDDPGLSNRDFDAREASGVRYMGGLSGRFSRAASSRDGGDTGGDDEVRRRLDREGDEEEVVQSADEADVEMVEDP